MPGHTHLKLWCQFGETLDVYMQAKKSTSSFRFSLTYCKDTVISGTLGMPSYAHSK